MSDPIQTRLEQGDLDGAIDAALEILADAPGDGVRFLLFQLLTISDRFDEAREQISRIGAEDPLNADGAAHFASLLEPLATRHAFLIEGQGEVGVMSSGAAPDWVADRVRVLGALSRGELETASADLVAWRTAHPLPPGRVDGAPCAGLGDADDALAPFLEIIVPGVWALVPFETLRSLTLAPLQGFPDRIWRQAELVTDERSGTVWIPGNYAGSGAADGRVALGDLTTFDYPSEDVRRARGQRDLALRAADGEETLRGLHGIETITMDAAAAP